jgi:hypothetical protein
MKTLINHLAIILIAFNLMTGCAPAGQLPIAEGQVLALSQRVTLTGVYSVLNGAQPLGKVFTNGQLSVVAWPQSGGWAWACLRFQCPDWAGQFRIFAGGNGNLTTATTFSQLAEFIKSKGFNELPKTIGPAALSASESIGGYLSQMAGALTGFMIVPVLPVPEEFQNQTIQG